MHQKQEQERHLDYTLVIGDNMVGSLHTFKSSPTIPVIHYNHELFYFDPRFTKQDVMEIYECDIGGVEKVEVYTADGSFETNVGNQPDNHIIIIPGGRFNYTCNERDNWEMLNRVIRMGCNHQGIEWYKMNASWDQKVNRPDIPYKSFNRSGYMGKTNGENNMYNMIDFIGGVSYVITLVSQDFIKPELTKSIIDCFRKYMDNMTTNYKYPDSNYLNWFNGPYTPFSSIMIGEGEFSFKNFLKHDPYFTKEFRDLAHPNIILNFHVLNKYFI